MPVEEAGKQNLRRSTDDEKVEQRDDQEKDKKEIKNNGETEDKENGKMMDHRVHAEIDETEEACKQPRKAYYYIHFYHYQKDHQAAARRIKSIKHEAIRKQKDKA